MAKLLTPVTDYTSNAKKVLILGEDGVSQATVLNPLPVDAVVTVNTMTIDTELSEKSGHDYYVTTTNLGDGTDTIGFDTVAGLNLENVTKVENKTQGFIYFTKGATVTTTSIAIVIANQTAGAPVPGVADEFEIVYRGTSRFDGINTDTTSISADTTSMDAKLTVPTTIGVKTNAAVGTTAEQLTTDSTVCKKAIITANPSNTGRITVGAVGVTDGNGIILGASDNIEVSIDNVNKIYVVASVDAEDVSATYFN